MERFIGTWRLVDWVATIDDAPHRPFGGKATGLLTYTADGRMTGTLMKQDRPDLASSTLGSASAGDRARVAAGYLGYAGSFRVEGDEVIHTVELSLFPNWVGGDQRRQVEWSPNAAGGMDLILSATTHPTGRKPVMNRLQWRKLSDWEIE